MSEAMVHPADALNERIAAEVRAELAIQRKTQTRLRFALGLSQSAMSRRMTGEQPFDAGQLAIIASILDVPVSRFYPADLPPPLPFVGEPNDTAVIRPTNPCYYDSRVILGPWKPSVATVTAA